jgi:hypothetical protein
MQVTHLIPSVSILQAEWQDGWQQDQRSDKRSKSWEESLRRETAAASITKLKKAN